MHFSDTKALNVVQFPQILLKSQGIYPDIIFQPDPRKCTSVHAGFTVRNECFEPCLSLSWPDTLLTMDCSLGIGYGLCPTPALTVPVVTAVSKWGVGLCYHGNTTLSIKGAELLVSLPGRYKRKRAVKKQQIYAAPQFK